MLPVLLFFGFASFGASVPHLNAHGVPATCARALSSLRADLPGAPAVDWRPWREYLKTLGYPDDYVEPLILRESKPDVNALLAVVRKALQQPEWTWADGLDQAQGVAVAQAYDDAAHIPFEYLAQIPGFDAPAAAAGYLARQRVDSLGEVAVRRLSLFAPFWLDGPNRLDLAKLFISKVECGQIIDAHRWTRRFLPREVRAHFLEDALTRLRQRNYCGRAPEDVLFKILDHVRLGELDPSERRRLRLALSLDGEPAPVRDDRIKVVSRALQTAGNCHWMPFGHLRLLWPAKVTRYMYQARPTEALVGPRTTSREPPLVVRVNGRVVGLVKMENDPSMLAMVNLVDAEGYRTLIKGGVYAVPADIECLPRGTCGKMGWPCVDLDRLSVGPVEPILGAGVWHLQNLPLVARMLGGPIDRTSRILLETAARGADDSDTSGLRRRFRGALWRATLERIDRVLENLR